MTNNHLLIHRLAELMLEKQQHILSLDDLFEDQQIAVFVRSIQIDSPYQQLIFEGVLTETIKEERVMVTFTVEGYFHYVLGEVIEKQTESKGADALKELLVNNKLRGIVEGVEQCLIRDVEQNNLSRLMWLIDEGGKALEASAYPLAQAFLIHPIERVMDELLADPTDNDIKVLEKAIENLEKTLQNDTITKLYKVINNVLEPDNILKASLYVKGIKHLPKEHRKIELDKISLYSINEENKIAGNFYFYLAEQFVFIAEYDKAIEYYKKSLAIDLKVYGDMNPSIGISYNNLGMVWNYMEEYNKSIEYYKKSLAIDLKAYGCEHPSTGTCYNNLGLVWADKGKYDKAIDYIEKSLEIELKVYGNWHSSTGMSYNNLSYVWNQKGEYNKAIEYLEKALAVSLKINGDKHPSTGICYNNLGNNFKAKKKYAVAKKSYQKAYDIFLNKFGKEHMNTKFVLNKIKNLNEK